MWSPPLLYFVIAIAGAFLGLMFSIPFFPALLVLLILSLLAAFLKTRLAKATLICAVLMGFVATLASNEHRRFQSLLAALPNEASLFEGTIEDLSDVQNGDRAAILHVSRLSPLLSITVPSFRILLKITGAASAKPVRIGDVVRVKGKLQKVHHALSVGELDGYWLGLSRGIHGRMVVSDPRLVAIVHTQQAFSLINSTKQVLKDHLMSTLSPREAGLLLALIVGDVKLFDEDQRSVYRNIGAGHLLAVSGLQISILSAIFYQSLLFFFLFIPWVSRRSLAQMPATAVAVVLIWGFVALCGAPPSAVRAATMSTLVLLARLIAWPTTSADAFGAAGLIGLIISPCVVVDPSFWLSYVAVFGLILAAECSSIEDSDTLFDPTKGWSRWKAKWRTMLVGSLSAGILTFPFSAFYFSQLSLTGLFVNIFLVPIAGFLQTPAILLASIGAIFDLPTLAFVAAQLAGILEAMCMTLNDLAGKSFAFIVPSSWSLFFCFVATVCLIGSIGARRRFAMLGVSCMSIAMAFLPVWLSDQKDVLRVTFLPVGQGDAAVVETSDGKVMLVDGGGNHDDTYNPGERVIIPFLNRRRIQNIDVMVLSHPDADHIMGLLPVIENFEVKEVWHSGFDETHPLMAKLIEAASRRNTRLHSFRAFQTNLGFGNATIDILTPDEENAQIHSTNNRSLVLRVSFEGQSILFPGDIEEEREVDLLKRNLNLQATIVKAAHHGSKSSSIDAFVKATGARHVVFCTGINNRFGFPHSQVVERWVKSGATFWNTATNGETAFQLSRDAVEVQPFISTSEDKS